MKEGHKCCCDARIWAVARCEEGRLPENRELRNIAEQELPFLSTIQSLTAASKIHAGSRSIA